MWSAFPVGETWFEMPRDQLFELQASIGACWTNALIIDRARKLKWTFIKRRGCDIIEVSKPGALKPRRIL